MLPAIPTDPSTVLQQSTAQVFLILLRCYNRHLYAWNGNSFFIVKDGGFEGFYNLKGISRTLIVQEYEAAVAAAGEAGENGGEVFIVGLGELVV